MYETPMKKVIHTSYSDPFAATTRLRFILLNHDVAIVLFLSLFGYRISNSLEEISTEMTVLDFLLCWTMKFLLRSRMSRLDDVGVLFSLKVSL